MIRNPALLDVNIPMYAAGQEHPYKAACVWVMREVAAARLVVVIDAETIQEVLYRYGAQQRWAAAIQVAANLLTIVPTIYAVTPADARRAMDLFRYYGPQGVKTRDLVHAAVMQNNGLTEIISTDTDFDRLAGLGIARLDPLVLYSQV